MLENQDVDVINKEGVDSMFASSGLFGVVFTGPNLMIDWNAFDAAILFLRCGGAS